MIAIRCQPFISEQQCTYQLQPHGQIASRRGSIVAKPLLLLQSETRRRAFLGNKHLGLASREGLEPTLLKNVEQAAGGSILTDDLNKRALAGDDQRQSQVGQRSQTGEEGQIKGAAVAKSLKLVNTEYRHLLSGSQRPDQAFQAR